MLRHFLSFVLALFIFNIVFSQYNNLIFKHISTEQGLSHRKIKTITQDHQEFIWIGTSHGLNKYDGYFFKTYLNDTAKKYSISNNTIRCIFEDSKNRLWVCTHSGLNLYDREKDRFISFLHDDNDSSSLKNNKTETIFEDHHGNLWVGHYDGFSKIVFGDDYQQDIKKSIKFLNISPVPNNNGSSINWIFNMCEDKDGNIWLGSYRNCMYRYSPIDGSIKHYPVIPDQNYNNNFDNRNWVKKVFIDNDYSVWICLHANQGLAKYDATSDRFVIYKIKREKKSEFDHTNTINDVIVDTNNTFWLVTDNGLHLFNYKNGLHKSFLYSSRKNTSISQKMLNCIFKDDHGGIWIGTSDKGINYSDRNLIKFNLINTYNYPDLETNNINELYCNENDEVFMYFFDYEYMFKYELDNDLLTKYNKLTKYFTNKRSDIVYARINDQIYYKNKGQTDNYLTAIPHSCTSNRIQITSNGDAWIFDIKGLYFYSKEKNTSSLIIEPNEKIIDRNIYIDEDDVLWIITQFGLRKLSQNNILEPYLESYNFIHSFIKIDSKNNFWMPTSGSILCFNRTTGETSVYGKEEGFNAITAQAIEVDKKGNIWVTSDKGLSKFDIKQKQFINYGKEDGLPFCNFIKASCQDLKGNMYFGSHDGVLIINPEDIQSLSRELPLVFTNFKLFNKEISVGTENTTQNQEFYLENQINETKEITLKHNQNVFSIEYAALNYPNPNKNQYAYYLEGLEANWNNVGKRMFASYSGLQPGSYVFRLKGTSNGKDWNEKEISLKIHILPPFWQTMWFRFFILLLLVTLIIGFIRIRMRVVNKQKNELEKLIKERTTEVQMQSGILKDVNKKLLEQQDQLEEANQVLEERQEEIIVQKEEIQAQADDLKVLNSTKDKFFSIIAHDLKNPFQAITGFSELMLNDFDSINKEQKIEFIKSINQSSISASGLLENLLQWARSQINKIDFTPYKFDLHTLVLDNCNLLQANANKKTISLINNIPKGTNIYGDRNILDTVIRNLVNNAIKFSLQNTKITLSSIIKEDFVIISVADQGVGMKQDVIDKLFRIDQHITNIGTSGESGTGLGLIICHDFIKKSNGEIWVESKPGEGSTFFIKIPFSIEQTPIISNEPANEEQSEQLIPEEEHKDDLYEILQDKEEAELNPAKNKHLILLIDDNPEIRTSIHESMKRGFSILEAENGKEGYKIATEEIPDLIVCDWMMPEMDGITFCKMIKKDERTSHIPCIMLTAKSASEDETQGLTTGADDYITKPFNTNNLIIKINNILNSRRKFREKFSREMGISIKYESSSEPDNIFMDKLHSIINQNITNPELNYKFITKEIGMSRTQLYKKINALTNLSAHGYIKKIRLHKAANMLIEENNNISEVAYQLCFNNPVYFTRCFTELYGKSPSQFIADNKR